MYGLGNNMNNGIGEANRFNSYGFDQHGRMNSAQSAGGGGGGGGGGSTALYHHHGSRYGLGLGGRMVGPDSKMNGLHGPKHKRGDMDRECMSDAPNASILLTIILFLSQPLRWDTPGGAAGRDPAAL